MGIEQIKWLIIAALTVGGIILIAMGKIDTTGFLAMLGGAVAVFGVGTMLPKGKPKS